MATVGPVRVISRVFAQNWTTGHALRRRIDSLDPDRDDEQIAALIANGLFADAYFAHSTYLVTFARQASVPAIAKVLYRSGNGDIATKPRQRNNDTIVYFTEFYRRGYRSPDGIAAIKMMEAIHDRFLISEELKLYTLATVMLEPDRLALQFGKDPFSDVDKRGRWNFWCGIAGVMGLTMPADSREGFLQWMYDFEAENYAHTEDAAGCYRGLVEDWLRWYPSWVPGRKWMAEQSLSALLDPTVRRAVGAAKPPAPVQFQVNLVARAYLESTPVRVFRKDRSLVNFFGREHRDPRSLEGVGHEPPQRAKSS
jgi:hypothetical protein